MEKYLYLTSDEYEAMVCISGKTPVTGFSKMKYHAVGERRKQILNLFSKGLVVNTGEAFVVCLEWRSAFACIHSAKAVLHVTAKNPEVPDILIYLGKYCVLLENISTKTGSKYRLSLWEPADLVQMLADSDMFPKVRVEKAQADVLRRSEKSGISEDGTEKIECSITKYSNGREDVLLSACFIKKESLWYVMKNSDNVKRIELADSGTVTEILQLLLEAKR